MSRSFRSFELIARSTEATTASSGVAGVDTHPFDERNIHPDISTVSKKLFDDGHFAQAVFEAYKYLEIEVKRISGSSEGGQKLMMLVFNESSASIKLTNLSSVSEADEQSGFRFIFAGVMSGIRNPRGHEIIVDTIDTALDYLSLSSVLLRRLEARVFPAP